MSLHHLFACETRCNSVRGNTPYDEFADSPQQTEPVTQWERHRNAAVFERQGNRNPSIDRPAPARSLVPVVAPLGSRCEPCSTGRHGDRGDRSGPAGVRQPSTPTATSGHGTERSQP